MSANKQKKSFIPSDKPKSLVLLMIGVATFVGCVLMLLLLKQLAINIPAVSGFMGFIGLVLFPIAFIAFGVSAISLVVYQFRRILGYYKNVTSKPWDKQIW